MFSTTGNRRTWRWFGPTLVCSALLLGYIFYTGGLSGTGETRHFASSGAYATFQEASPGRPDLAGHAEADGAPLEKAITVVTGFLPTKPHDKDIPLSGDPYSRWMEWSKVFRNMSNPVIAYLGSVQYMFYFESVRGRRAITNTNMTIVTLPELGLHKLKPRIEAALAKTNLGMTADQLIHQHGKYELLHHAAIHNPFRTTHMIYLDPRDYTSAFENSHTFRVLVPDSFDITRVAYRTFSKFESLGVADIFHKNKKWVEGDFIMGATDTVAQWCQTYLQAFSSYLDAGYIGSDEATVYAMISDPQNNYRDMVNTYPAGEPGFAQWYQKLSGSKKPYSVTRKKRDIFGSR